MVTAESVKNKLRGLIDTANATTGKADTDLTAAVGALVAGFGAGGVSAVARGSITRTSDFNFNTKSYTIEHGLGVRPRVVIVYADSLASTTGYTLRYFACFREVINGAELYSSYYSRVHAGGGSYGEYSSVRKEVPEHCDSDLANWNTQTVVIKPVNTILVPGITYHWVVVG